jgi:hypothetical protein
MKRRPVRHGERRDAPRLSRPRDPVAFVAAEAAGVVWRSATDIFRLSRGIDTSGFDGSVCECVGTPVSGAPR